MGCHVSKSVYEDIELRNNEWYADFHMTYMTYEKLYDILKPYIVHRDTNYRDALSIHKAI